MGKWKFKVETVSPWSQSRRGSSFSTFNIEWELDNYAKDGWELVTLTPLSSYIGEGEIHVLSYLAVLRQWVEEQY